MKAVDDVISKVATMTGKMPSYERPKGEHTNPSTNEYHISKIFDHTAHTSTALPIVLEKAEGAYVWDVTGKKYLDMMGSFGCANQGHGHPKILNALVEQAKKLAVTSLTTNHNMLGPVSKHLTERLGYEKILFMNSGAEAVDTAVLTARRWGYQVKKVPIDQATILFPKMCYWGMLTSSRAGTDDPIRREQAGPLASEAQRYDFVTFDNPEELEAKFKANPNIVAYIFEPIQSYAGNIHPTPGYYTKVRELCTKYNVLMVADEMQTGLGRTGKLFACDWENVRPDMITIGDSLSGEFMPISAVLADSKIMDVWTPGTHSSSYAGSSLACAVSKVAVDVLFEENLIQNAEKLGRILEDEFKSLNHSFIKRKFVGKGLFASIELKDNVACLAVCNSMREKGVLAMSVDAFVRVMPPLCITETDFRSLIKVLREALDDYEKKGKLGLIV